MGLPKVDFEWDFAKPIPEDQKKGLKKVLRCFQKMVLHQHCIHH